MQKSFLDAFLKGEDSEGWSVPGKVPAVSLCLRRGNPGYNDAEAEVRAFPRRSELEWPIKRTVKTKYHLGASKILTSTTADIGEGVLSYEAPKGDIIFTTLPFTQETEITGHPILRLSVALRGRNGSTPSELDVFVTLRHYDAEGKESKLRCSRERTVTDRAQYFTQVLLVILVPLSAGGCVSLCALSAKRRVPSMGLFQSETTFLRMSSQLPSTLSTRRTLRFGQRVLYCCRERR